MSRHVTQARFYIAILSAFAFLLPAMLGAAAQEPPDLTKHEYVLELERDQDPYGYAPTFLSLLGVPGDEQPTRLVHTYEVAIVGFSVMLTVDEIAKAERLIADDQVAGIQSISQSHEMTIPALDAEASSANGSSIMKNAEVIPTGIERIASTAADASGVDVAVIDTGVDAKHPELNVVGGRDCTVPDGQIETWGVDENGHGTHVAGTIGAKANGIGVVGVAPGARIWAVKVLNAGGSGTYGSVLCGLEYVAAHRDVIDVANMSLGGPGADSECGGDDPLHNAICVVTESVVVVVAAGNSAMNAASFAPAGYPEVVTVGAYADFDGQPGGAGLPPAAGCTAFSLDDQRASFSNFGEVLDLYGPGVCTLSTLPRFVDANGDLQPGYGYGSGTSMASPHVAGAVAQYLAANPDQRDRAVSQLLDWAEANGEAVAGDPGIRELHLLYIGPDGIPRYEGAAVPRNGR